MSEEKIGNVILDLSFYKGTDTYSDGESVEDRILDIVKSGEDIDRRLAEGSDWAELYHLSDIRKNILSWADMDKSASALEIGSGCGAVTGILCEKCGSVTCVDLSKKRSSINAYRNKDHDNLRIMVGNFEDVEFKEKFDIVTLIGVFEYSIYYISSNDPFVDMLKKCRSLLKEGGKLYIAIENKYGMKYFAGACEDHTGRPFDGIEGYHGVERVRTFSGYALDAMLKAAGFKDIEFRYPVPDYKLPMEIYSDRRLPGPGDITCRSPNYDRAKIECFDEIKATDQVCADGLYPDFANSFVITASPDAFTEKCIYAKFNTLRCREYRVDTRIVEENGKLYAVKSPACKEAVSHIDRIEQNRVLTDKCYRTIKPVGVVRKGDELYFDYVSGLPFDHDCIDYAVSSLEDIRTDVNKHLNILMNNISQDCRCTFEKTDEFREFYGDIDVPDGIPGLKNINLDMIFGNFLITKSGMVCIDYEWLSEFPVPEDYIRYRVFRCIFESYVNIPGQIKTRQQFAAFMGIDENLTQLLDEMENAFQKRVAGDGLGMDSLNNYKKLYGKLEDELREKNRIFEDNENLRKEKEELQRRLSEQQSIVEEQQAYIEKLKKAIKNPFFAVKWAAKKAVKKK